MRRAPPPPWLLQAAVSAACLAPLVFELCTNHSPAFVRQERLTATAGLWSLRLVVAALAVRPVAELTRQPWILRCRRAVGLFAFGYALLHLVVYAIRSELWLTPANLLQTDLAVGMLAFILLIPLAATSTNAMMRRLGPTAWRRLHAAIYLIGPLAVAHQILIDRSLVDGLIYGGLVAALLAWRGRPLLRYNFPL